MARADAHAALAPHGFYGGAAGAAAALVLAGGELDDTETSKPAAALLLRLPMDPPVADTTDVIGGIAGTVLALALAADALDRDAALIWRAQARFRKS